MTIGIILGSIREGRVGGTIADWIYSVARDRNEAEYELVDLKDYDLPLYTGATPPMMLKGNYEDPKVVRWAEKINSFDGFVFVTAEHNSSVPAPMKNAFDSLSDEWRGKPILFAGYSYHGGVQTVKAWEQVIATFNMPQVAQSISINLGAEVKDGVFTPAEGQLDSVNKALSELEKLVAEAAK